MSNTCIIKQWPIYVYMKYNEKSACLGLQEIQLGDESKLMELYTLEIPFIWAKPTGDLHLVCLLDGMDKTFSCKNRKKSWALIL